MPELGPSTTGKRSATGDDARRVPGGGRDRVRATAEVVRAARSRVLAAHELAFTPLDGLAAVMGGSRPEHHASVVGVLSDTVSAIVDVAEYAATLGAALNGFADRLGRTASAAPAAMPPVTATAVPPGRWKGKTAKEHVLNGGEDIGHAPKGRKRMPIRLLDTFEELHEMFTALKAGAELRPAKQYAKRTLLKVHLDHEGQDDGS